MGWSFWSVFGALLLIVGITVGVYSQRAARAYLLVGWLWYLVMLAPVSGVVFLGYVSSADRYAYLPQVGLFVAATWFLSDCLRNRGFKEKVIARSIIGCILLTLGYASWKQAGY